MKRSMTSLRTLLPVPALLLLLSLQAFAPADAAEIYKCTNENGKLVYQNTPCANAESVEKLDIESNPTDPDAVKARQEARKEKLESFSEAAEKKREAREAEAKARKQQREECAAARERLAKLERAQRLTSTNEKGEVTYLPSEDLVRQREEARERVRKTCGD